MEKKKETKREEEESNRDRVNVRAELRLKEGSVPETAEPEKRLLRLSLMKAIS